MMQQLLDNDLRPSPIQRVTDDVTGLRTVMVNLYFVGRPGFGPWVLVDAGLPGSADIIIGVAEKLFGAGTRPEAIILTHGHFDHVGSLQDLLRVWDVPVFAHRLEMPYLTGRSNYPPPDPSVGGGMMAVLAPLYPREGIDLGERVHMLPSNGIVPGLPGWEWIHTPGHTAGHVSLFRRQDRLLIAGDAFVTTKQESAMAVLTQRRELHGPPAYFTTDWRAAWRSVERLAALEPEVAATGHGLPMRGEPLRRELQWLARTFLSTARPRHGRYVLRPAVTDERGVISVPPPVPNPATKVLVGMGALALAGAALYMVAKRSGDGHEAGREAGREAAPDQAAGPDGMEATGEQAGAEASRSDAVASGEMASGEATTGEPASSGDRRELPVPAGAPEESAGR